MSITLTNEFLGLPAGPIDHNASSIINSICGDASLKIGDVVKLLPVGAVFKKELKVLAGDVTGASPLVDFPLLVSITDTDLRDNARADGFDIFFTKSDGTVIPYDRESYNSVTGELVAWVLTDLSDTADNTIFMFYGNPNSTDQQNPLSVWNTRFEDVFHFNQSAPLPWLNSSVSNDFTILESGTSPTPVVGQIDTASDISSTSFANEVSFRKLITTVPSPSDFFVSLWIKFDTISTDSGSLLDCFLSAFASIGNKSAVFIGSGVVGSTPSAEKIELIIADNGIFTEIEIGDMIDLAYHHVAIRYSSGSFDLFFDGVITASSPFAYVFVDPVQFDASQCGGGIGGVTTPATARIDQLQVALNSNFSNGFIKTSFDNQKTSGQGAGNFVKVGPQESSTSFTSVEDLLPRVGVVNDLGEQAYGIVVGGDFEGIYDDGVIPINSDNLALGIIVSFFGEGVRICTRGRCLALASAPISVGDKLTASPIGLVNANGGNIIATALQPATELNSIIAVDIKREGFIPGGGFVYYINKVGAIETILVRADLSGGNAIDLQIPQSVVAGIALDSNFIYFTDPSTDKLIRADFDGTNQVTLLTGIGFGVAVDSTSIYFSHAGVNTIEKTDLDGTNQVELLTGLGLTIDMVVDSTSIYFTDSDTAVNKVNLDGTNHIILPITLPDREGISVDANFIYLADTANAQVLRTDLFGLSPTTFAVTLFPFPAGIAVSSKAILLGSKINEAFLVKMDLDGTNQVSIPKPELGAVTKMSHFEITK